MTHEEKNDFIKTYFRYFDRYMKFCLASIPERKFPQLFIKLDGESYTNHEIIHIGIGEIQADTEEDLMRWVLYVIGHEVQHILSTTQKAWTYGLDGGYHRICEVMSAKIEKKKRLFLKEDDYTRFLKDMESYGYKINPNALRRFVHFIINSLEDGRIERIRCIKRPRYQHYVTVCRGNEWKRNPVDPEMADNLSDPRTHLTVALNQLLTLATMSIYQKDFVSVCGKDINIHKTMQKIMPLIKKAVASNTCRECMDCGIQICGVLAEEIMEAAKLTDLEELLKNLIEKIIESQEFIADSRTEETGDGMQITVKIFGESDMENDSLGDRSSEGVSKSSEDDEAKGDSKGSGNSGDKKSDEDTTGNSGPEGSNPADTGNGSSSGDAASGSGTGESGDPNGDSAKNSSNMEDKINDSMEKAEDKSAAEVNAGISGGHINKAKQPKKDVEGDSDSEPVDQEAINEHYGGEVKYIERKREYSLNAEMPPDVKSQAEILKRKIERIFRNRRKPTLRGQRKGKIDAGRIYKLPMSQMDIFKQQQITDRFDGACFILQDNSGSMGNGRYSKRYHCCKAVAITEHAFQDVMPVKIAAFDATGNNGPRHIIVKNWNEKVTHNAAWNFLENHSSGWGNKDGYSIRVATQELLRRPERKKILFVLSDGIPTDYPGGYLEGQEDVKAAVKAARKAGVEVVAIFFGESLKDDDPDVQVFYNMYERNCIVTEPDLIMDPLVRCLKRFCFR